MRVIIGSLLMMLNVCRGYNVIVYPGSFVNKQRYTRLIGEMRDKLGNGSKVMIDDYKLCRQYPEKDTILVGHSFGGTFALLDAKYKQNVKAVVLLNSHFNSRGKMPYSKIDVKDISQPVLTILGTKDRKLDFVSAIDDLFYTQDEHIKNKYFLVKEGYGHYTSLNDGYCKDIAEDIVEFIDNPKYSLKSHMKKWCWYNENVWRYRGTYEMSQSLNLLDAILRNVVGWKLIHYWLFLMSKPNKMENFQYTNVDSTLLKSFNTTGESIVEYLDTQVFQDRYKIDWKFTTLPTRHLSIFMWLYGTPKLTIRKDECKGEIIMLPINENITYYKYPTRYCALKAKYRK